MYEPEQKCENNAVFKQNYTAKLLVHPDIHWPNSFATDFCVFHWDTTYTDSTWHGYTKGVSMVVAIATSN